MHATAKQNQVAVAIPVRDEAAGISACLQALDGQLGARVDHIVLLMNNCSDGSAAIARAFPFRSATTLHVIDCELPPALANAGHARRLAMDAGLALLDPDGILMTTDADGQVDPDWVAATLKAFAHGVDAVAGWVELHPLDWGTIPTRLHEDDARECAYDALCDEIHAWLDPDAADPWPRHTQHSGASIAIRADTYVRCGGVPAVAVGEDRALIAALRRIDARVRHAPEVHAVVSGRTVGRATGGMADTIRRRLTRPDDFIDARLEPAAQCARRAFYRAEAKRAYVTLALDRAALAHGLGLPIPTTEAALRCAHFGEAWEALEQAAPMLRRQAVAVADLARETASARTLLNQLRAAPASAVLPFLQSVGATAS